VGTADRPLTDVVARRELDIKGSNEKVIVELGRPYARPTGEFGCPYRIAFGETVIQQEIFGEDGFQALQLTLNMISVLLHFDQDLPVGRMYWLDPDFDIGFPAPEVPAPPEVKE
jgi:Domain of unknown function (DUF6968)